LLIPRIVLLGFKIAALSFFSYAGLGFFSTLGFEGADTTDC